jgi:hypothetical protein
VPPRADTIPILVALAIAVVVGVVFAIVLRSPIAVLHGAYVASALLGA